ncbi:hypothetical protein M4578_02640 [Salipiger sp. P9]|uniref:hypothetical protein n=1 Tax=Salipiger pentaromativorans TaxID=2943193 RepID=UPI002157C385|nr:hypothetical protein [Salipiger pentaromativorans]MCR8546711.1 hypothetical protein [Salipiger pentaromativorans]
MDIFSKRDGPRAEDVRAKRMISENAPVIRKLADQISGGGYTAMQQAKAKKPPQPKGLIIHDLGSARSAAEPEPYVKISLNNRVVLADKNSGRQLHMLGEIRSGYPARFVPATAENGFFSPLPEDVYAAIRHLEEQPITREFGEKQLAAALEESLGLT